MLNIINLKVKRDDKLILNDFNLNVKAGELHLLLGKNGSGKSTLATTLAGHPDCHITAGQILFNDSPIANTNAFDRASAGIFVSFQQPIAIPGLNLFEFLRTIYNAKRQRAQLNPVMPEEFLTIIKPHLQRLQLEPTFLSRTLNADMSGGEQKRCELLQMLLLEPKLIVLDEIDSGLDSAGQILVSTLVPQLITPTTAVVVITHNPRLFFDLPITAAHLINGGRITNRGQQNLLAEIIKHGYDRFR